MFNVVHQGRKYAPTRCSLTDDSPLTVRAVNVVGSPGTLTEPPEGTWPPPGAKMRVSKGAVVVRAARRHPAPQPASLESLEAAWSQRGREDKHRSPERRTGAGEAGGGGGGGGGGGPPRTRRKAFRPPDVRTIFEKDPRVQEESGEGHSFQPLAENTWCDVCCLYIFQQGLTCAGCKYSCHAACRDRVSLDCHPAASPISQDQLNNNTTLHVSPSHSVLLSCDCTCLDFIYVFTMELINLCINLTPKSTILHANIDFNAKLCHFGFDETILMNGCF